MVFKVELDGRVISCSSPACINILLLHGWKLAEPTQWDDFIDALLSEEGLTASSESGVPATGVVTRASSAQRPPHGVAPHA
jgi:hypothetical protein